MAVVQLQFQKDVDDPLKPLRDDISDGYLRMFKVERQLDLNPSMFDPLTIFSVRSLETFWTEIKWTFSEVFPFYT